MFSYLLFINKIYNKETQKTAKLSSGSLGWPYIAETLQLYSQDPNVFFAAKQKLLVFCLRHKLTYSNPPTQKPKKVWLDHLLFFLLFFSPRRLPYSIEENGSSFLITSSCKANAIFFLS